MVGCTFRLCLVGVLYSRFGGWRSMFHPLVIAVVALLLFFLVAVKQLATISTITVLWK